MSSYPSLQDIKGVWPRAVQLGSIALFLGCHNSFQRSENKKTQTSTSKWFGLKMGYGTFDTCSLKLGSLPNAGPRKGTLGCQYPSSIGRAKTDSSSKEPNRTANLRIFRVAKQVATRETANLKVNQPNLSGSHGFPGWDPESFEGRPKGKPTFRGSLPHLGVALARAPTQPPPAPRPKKRSMENCGFPFGFSLKPTNKRYPQTKPPIRRRSADRGHALRAASRIPRTKLKSGNPGIAWETVSLGQGAS